MPLLNVGFRAAWRTLSPACYTTLAALAESRGDSALLLKSTSTDIYENLALEDWLHEYVQSRERHVLLLWRNCPTVVIGRHQNPWQECNLKLMRDQGIQLSRRRSGGGTVYHDLGNINLTFFTSKKKYDRRGNLELVISALKRIRPQLNVLATDRYDLLLNGVFKISGTASKIGRTSAYHHCTLLCNSNRHLLSSVLHSPHQGLKTNATPSIPATVKNLCDEDPTLTCDLLMDAIAMEYARRHSCQSKIVLVDPKDNLLLPGIAKFTQELKSWDWIYGRTPKFSISHYFSVDHNLPGAEVELNMSITHGRIESCNIKLFSDWLPSMMCNQLASDLIGNKFCPTETLILASAYLRVCSQDNELSTKWNALCEQVMAIM
ncbi:lipoyltransferase 1, mitochondrial [Chiloscyllium plagiosum]|uniref:lipoyltransferase 1, mitochondrial n=1 Tax=Chiloscyllium plagiosum TaxID=36176 RepID=UPI001CB87D03|nr:lipoyltransferase 1, mitochondrial [Chiloscyllium plagiosum]XP_043548150.1 lipoyltransferase 1, mitochondrial [Chiloscyllium plagiosum]